MKAICFAVALFAGSILAWSPQARGQFATLYPKPALSFVENRGQIRDQYGRVRSDIGFQVRIKSGFNIFVGPGLLHYQWSRSDAEGQKMERVEMRLVGANTRAQVKAEKGRDYYEQYTLSGVATTVRSFRKLTYRDIYPNIDWVIYLKGNVAEYDFVVRPGGKVSDIRMQYSGAHRLGLETDGTIRVRTAMGSITETAPLSYASGKKVASAFTLQDNVIGFRTGAYTGTLVIDPVLVWGSYVGGLLNETAFGLATDKRGNVYVAGSSASTSNIATTGSYQTSYGGGTGSASYLGDAYLAKFSPSGTPLWITYYGGSAADQGLSVTVDSADRVYLSGFTSSTSGISTTGAQQPTPGGGIDAFLVCFDSSGARQWGTYFGGASNENVMTSVRYSQAAGAVYLSGITNSSSGIATTGAHQTTIGGSTDAYVAKYSLSGTLQWATYFGGTGAENNYAQLATDRFGNAYLCGITTSGSGISTTGSHQATYGGATDGYLVKFNAAGVRQWSTYYGGSAYDRLHSIVCNDSGFVYGLGSTLSSSGIASTGAYQTSITNSTALDNQYLVKFDSAGTRQWGTYYCGNQYASGASGSLSLGITGSVYFTGFTNSTTGIATSGTMKDTLTAGDDAYLVKFNSGGQRMWGTYYGGGLNETGRSTITDRFGNVFLCGETGSGTGISTSGAYQGSFAGGNADGYLVKFNDCDTPATPAPITGNTVVCKGKTYTYAVPAMSGALSYSWTLPNGWTGSSTVDSITVTAGTDTGSIEVVGIFPCINTPARKLSLKFLADAKLTPSGRQALCAGDTLTLHSSTGNYTYQWKNNGGIISGATDSILKVAASGRYSVIVTNGSCSDTSGIDTVTVHPLPVPMISAAGNTLSTGAYATYQWHYNGTQITGAASQRFLATLAGTYRVDVTDTNGCSGSSAGFAWAPANVLEAGSVDIQLSPNPASTIVNITAPVAVNVCVSSMDGRVVIRDSAAATIDLGGLSGGLYLVRITDRNGHVLKVEKLTVLAH